METQTILAIPKQEDKEMVLYLGTQFPSHVQVTGYFWKVRLQTCCAVRPCNQALCSADFGSLPLLGLKLSVYFT